MTTLENGDAYCDKCGGDLTPVNLVNAVMILAMLDDGGAHQFHYCRHADVERGTKNCAPKTVLSPANLKAFQSRNPEVEVRLFDADRDAPDGTVGDRR